MENALRPGIAAVTARVEDGTLRILPGACPNLLAEAELYRYSTESQNRRAETPEDDTNHARGALRYLISILDAHKLKSGKKTAYAAQTEKQDAPAPKKWLSLKNEALWRRIF
jgi:hypothetical protein